MRGGIAQVPRLVLFGLCFAHGAAGFDSRCAQQPGDLLEVQLDCVGAQDFSLRETRTGVAHSGHAVFELRDVFFEIEIRRRDLKAPGVNALCQVLKS